MPRATLREALERYKKTFGGGMVPFDNAYWEAREAGHTMAEAQRRGGHALLHAFVEAVEEEQERNE